MIRFRSIRRLGKKKAKPEHAWQAVRRAASRNERKIVRLYREAAAIAKKVVDYSLHDTLRNRDTDQRAINQVAEHFSKSIADQFAKNFTVALSDTLESAGRAQTRLIKRAQKSRFAAATKGSFNVVNPAAQKWIRDRAGDNITGISDASREAIRQILADSYRRGLPNSKVITHIKAIIGLNEQQASAVMSLADRIAENPGGKVDIGGRSVRVPEDPSDEWVDDHLEDYADDLLTSRAKTIARTETIAAANEGQRQAWLQAADDGLLDAEDVERVWIVTDDDRLCPICEALDGETASLDGQFDSEDVGPLDGPPAHPNCRCAQGLQEMKSGRAATAGMHKHATTQIEISPVVRSQISRLQIHLPESVIHPRYGREMNPHITVLYGVVTGPEEVRAVVKDFGPVSFTIDEAFAFEGVEDGTADAVALHIGGDDLHRLREQILQNVPSAEQKFEYEPHLTLAYVHAGVGKAVAKQIPTLGLKIMTNMLMYRATTGASTHLFLGPARSVA